MSKASMTEAERKALQRAAKREQGLVPVEVWVRPHLKDTVKRLVADLNAKHGRKNK